MLKLFSLVLLSIAMSLVGSVAAAQDSGGGQFKRDRNVSVKERPKPGYETDGIRSGAFTLKPQLDIQAQLNDNIFATDINEESDIILVIAPSINIESSFSRHSLKAFVNVERQEYLDFDTESVTNFGLGGEGRLDVKRGFYFGAGANYRQGHEGRTAAGVINGALNPIEFGTTNYFVNGVHERGRAKLQASVAYGELDYDDAELVGGLIADQDFRDRNDLDLAVRGDYAVSPDTSVFARLRYTDQDNRIAPLSGISRDQIGYILDVGADFDLTNLIRGEVGVGYLSRSFDSPVITDFDGFSYTGRIEWFATPLVTVSATGARSVKASGLLLSPAFVETSIGVTADYEWRRNIIFSTGYNFRDENYRGIDRNDNRNSFFIGGTYLMNRHVGFTANLLHSSLNSDGASSQSDFGVTEILFGITLKR